MAGVKSPIGVTSSCSGQACMIITIDKNLFHNVSLYPEGHGQGSKGKPGLVTKGLTVKVHAHDRIQESKELNPLNKRMDGCGNRRYISS